MSLGSLATLARYAPPNLLVLLLENRQYETTGGQALPVGADFCALARAAGFEGGGASGAGKVERIETLSAVEEALPRLLTEDGPHFVALPVVNHEPVPPTGHTDHAGRVVRLRTALGLA